MFRPRLHVAVFLLNAVWAALVVFIIQRLMNRTAGPLPFSAFAGLEEKHRCVQRSVNSCAYVCGSSDSSIPSYSELGEARRRVRPVGYALALE